MRRLRPAVLIAWAVASTAQAGMFDDDVARRQVAELKAATEARYETHSKALVDLVNQLQSLRDEQAKLRGQLEVIGNGIEQVNKRLQDYYVDLDNRLRKLEPQAATEAPAKNAADLAVESQEYEAALSLFKAAKYKEAAAAFTVFADKRMASSLAPSAQFWLGNSWYAQRDCKRAIEAQNVLLSKWPNSPRAPEAMLAIATCQVETGATATARRTLEALVTQYPEAPAAETARQRLKKK